MPRVERTDPEGVDYGWVMQVTFVLTVVVGAPVVAVLSVGQSLPDWEARAAFAVRVGAVVWILTALAVYAYARRTHTGTDDAASGEPGATSEEDPREGDDDRERSA